MKIVDIKHMTRDQLTSLKNEIEVMTELSAATDDGENDDRSKRSNYIVRLHEVFQEKSRYFLVLEKMSGGELFDRIVDKETYHELDARNACLSMLRSMQYCHQKRIVHRDLKPENILLQSPRCDSTLKIADFGLARKVHTPNSLRTLCGTPAYVAPEVLDEELGGYDVAVDMWSLGVILYIMLGGYLPFDDTDQLELYEQILDGDFDFEEKFWGPVSQDAKDLISGLLTVDAKKRLTADQALESKWMTSSNVQLAGNDLCETLPELRDFNVKRKLRAAVATIKAAHKLRTLVWDSKHAFQGSGKQGNMDE